MKPNKLVQIKNVVRADACIQFLMNRPKTEMVGLGLIYGKPGLGKTTYASRIAFMRGYIYMRLESTTTPKSFAVDLMTALYRRFGLGDYIPSGTTNNIFKYCLKLLDDNPETVIVIDEIDYAFKHEKLLGAIRDIVDETLTIVVLVGMQDARNKLAAINRHYFDRCNYFYEFNKVGKDDIRKIAKEVMEIPVDEDVVNKIDFNCGGNLRRAVKIMYIIERAKAKNPQLCIADLDLGRDL